MSWVVDASVGVAAARVGESGHEESRRFLRSCLRRGDELVVPSLFAVEVAAALGRRGAESTIIRRYVRSLVRAPNRVVVIGPKAADRIVRVALRYRLRGADAVYAWLADRESLPLITLDREHIERYPGAVLPADA